MISRPIFFSMLLPFMLGSAQAQDVGKFDVAAPQKTRLNLLPRKMAETREMREEIREIWREMGDEMRDDFRPVEPACR